MADQNIQGFFLEKPLKGFVTILSVALHFFPFVRGSSIVSLAENRNNNIKSLICLCVCSVTGGELFEDIVAREYYSEADARYSMLSC